MHNCRAVTLPLIRLYTPLGRFCWFRIGPGTSHAAKIGQHLPAWRAPNATSS